MNFNTLSHTIMLLAIIVSSSVSAAHTTIAVDRQHSSSVLSDITKPIVDAKPLSCSVDTPAHDEIVSNQSTHSKVDNYFSVSLVYLNDVVKEKYNAMRNGVINYVTTEVALSLFNFGINGFAAENIASYVSAGTKQFLPFEFANGVKITDVTPKGGTIVYRTEMPIAEENNHALLLAVAGRVSAISTVLNDKDMVDDLLGRNVVIQYDYYDSKGAFFCTFTIDRKLVTKSV
ncbi:MAG: hypothetical protein GQ583_09275 [Methyloprofundus sp.]|nr:hypothetical protein [Methyloprofundus sp.]